MKNRLLKILKKEKPWGREIWFAWTDRYAGKILHLKKGHRFSLQYHEKKEETQYIVSGKVKVTSGKTSRVLGAGQKFDVPARTVHRAEALQKTVMLEVSTPELDDVVKLSDDYGRTGKGNNEALDRTLAMMRPRAKK